MLWNSFFDRCLHFTCNCHHIKPKLTRFGCLAKNYRMKVSSGFAHIWWKNPTSCLFSLTIFHRWSLQMSNKYQQIEKCCPVLIFQTVYFYDFCGRQNHCPKSKCYHRGNTGTERLSMNGNGRVKGFEMAMGIAKNFYTRGKSGQRASSGEIQSWFFG